MPLLKRLPHAAHGCAFGRAAILAVLASASFGFFGSSLAVAGSELTVVSHHPSMHSTAVVETRIRVTFDRPVDPATVTCDEAFWAIGRWSGKVTGEYVVTDGGRTVALIPDAPFSAGEAVTVLLSHDIAALDGSMIRAAGYSFQFWTRAGAASRTFTNVQVQTTNIASESSRPYGGIAADLNGDRYPDLAMVNEDSNDVRVLLNLADCTGMVSSVVTPVAPTGFRGSPSEPCDFNRDGRIDMCVSNVGGGSISVLLGKGDGTFEPHQEVPGASDAHGIAVLDADGDGDFDIATSNQGSNSMALFLNDGLGVFAAPILFNAGMPGEWVVAATDMDRDGIADLVVGSRSTSQIAVLTGNGDATFDVHQVTAAGGEVWMLVLGDLDGNGYPDVTTANGLSNTASAIFNTDGMLGDPVVYPIDPFGTATDLGDLDGDGDLDWVTSSFGGEYYVRVNDGAGNFVLERTIAAPSNGSCALLVDLDNDSDLDMALVDEIADTVSIFRNDGSGPDCDGNSIPDFCDITSGLQPDCNGNGVPDSCDIAAGFSLDIDGNAIPDECETPIVTCGAGAVDAGCGGARDLLRINGNSAPDLRSLAVGPSTPFMITIAEAPSRRCDGATSRCCVYAWTGTPEDSDLLILPQRLGVMCYGPAVFATRMPQVVWNSIGVAGRLGEDNAPGPVPLITDGGGFELLSLPAGVGFPIVGTIQAIVEDDCSQGAVPFSVTNGMTFTVR